VNDKLTTYSSADTQVGYVPLLELTDVSLRIHDTPILSDISLQIHAGKTLGIIGESGSGKSMTALSIMQLLPRGSELTGNIRFENQQLETLSEDALCDIRGSDIGMIFQEPMTALNPVKSIGNQVSESIRLHRRVSSQVANELMMQTLERVGLPNAEFPPNRYPHELSGGQRQRVVIAIAIACQPKLLIADEPTTALDVTTQAGILELLKSLQHEEGLALMLITHDLAVVSNMADDVVVMKDGHIVEQGSLHAVFARPSNDYTRLLFEASALTQIDRRQVKSALPSVHEALDIANVQTESTDTTVLETTALNTVALDDAAQDTAALDTVALDTVALDTVALDAAALDTAALDATALDRPLLQVKDLVCEYRVPQSGLFKRATFFRAVDSVSFDIQHGESVGLVGESGCGKSTLTRALLGLMNIHSGTVLLNGHSVRASQKISKEARRQMQVVFQDPYGSFNPRHKVLRLVSEPLFLLDKHPDSRRTAELVYDVLESVGMQRSDADKYIHEFSGGQRQRIAIARALILKPSLIILDEAVSALDVSVRAQVLELLFISHDLSVVRRVSDRVLVMQNGRIVERGDTTEVFSRPQHSYTKELISAAPQLNIPMRAG